MNSSKKNKVSEGGETVSDHMFFVEDSIISDEEGQTSSCRRKHQKSLSRASSPPLLLAFSIISGETQQDTSSVSSADSQEQVDEGIDQPIEEWMILDGEEQMEDSSIQINLGCWDSPEEDLVDEDMTGENRISARDTWTISDKDKYGAAQSLGSRYFMAGRSSVCNICNKMGHVAKSCYFHKKWPTCVLCGIQGHIQRNCPSRPCSTCGLPSHDLNPCRVPPVWKQHCQRCGVTGHLSAACPDTWRQYHLTVKLGVPFRPRAVCALKPKSRVAHCYNCSKRGHYGHECTKRRMISGTFPSLPYVCQYDTFEEILQQSSRALTPAKEPLKAGSLPFSQEENLAKKTSNCCKDKPSVQGSSGTKKEAWLHPGRRKTWPERRRERREVKRLRREAQAKREGGLLGKRCLTSDDAVCLAEPFRHILHRQRQPKPPPEKKRREEKTGKKSRKRREAERWRKRGGIKRGDLYPHCDIDIGSENFLSPKQRVRHRRR